MVGRKGNRNIKHFKILKAKKQMLKRYRHRILRKAESWLWRKERNYLIYTKSPQLQELEIQVSVEVGLQSREEIK